MRHAQFGLGLLLWFALPVAGASGQAAVPSGSQPAAGAQTSPEAAAPDADGAYDVSGPGVSPPVVVHSVDPSFGEEARYHKFSCTVVVGLIVDYKGMPQKVHVTKGVGNSLDDRAVEAVRQYRFKPAKKDGVPVPVKVLVAVNFKSF